MSNVALNTSSFARNVLDIVTAKDKSDTGAFALIQSNREDIDSLRSKVMHARGIEGMSVRAVITEFFGASPEGEKVLQRYADLVELKSNVSPDQRAEKATAKRRINTVNMMLTRVVDVLSVITSLEQSGFDIRFRKVPNTGATLCKVRGTDDDDYAVFSVAQVLKLQGKSVDMAKSYAALQDLAKTAKAGTANESKGNTTSIVPGKIADTVDALDTAIAGYDLSVKDNGLTPGARANLLALWARLDAEFTPEQKAKARAEFEGDADAAEAA